MEGFFASAASVIGAVRAMVMSMLDVRIQEIALCIVFPFDRVDLLTSFYSRPTPLRKTVSITKCSDKTKLAQTKAQHTRTEADPSAVTITWN